MYCDKKSEDGEVILLYILESLKLLKCNHITYIKISLTIFLRNCEMEIKIGFFVLTT